MKRSAAHPKSKPLRKKTQTRPCRIASLRPGHKCPQCQQARLDYDGLLNLSCPQCGFVAGGGGFS